MPDFLKNLTHHYREQVARHKNLPFLKATMAASAVVSMSDGEITFDERMRVDQVLETLEALKVFDPHEGVNLFNGFVEALKESPEAGHAEAVAAIMAGANDPEKAELMIRICLALSESDGEVSLVEQIEIVTLCSLLGLDARAFGLYRDEIRKALAME
ncbi:MAG: tellurite resistance TerB family protein [Alphaproteobacteria bacterium]|nr:tellurite resistance TerB family protein [Alphaproteobacteria bacterium]